MERPIYTPAEPGIGQQELATKLIGDMNLRLAYLASLDRDGFVLWNDYAARAPALIDGKWESLMVEDAPVFTRREDATPGWTRLRAFDHSPIQLLPRGEAIDLMVPKILRSIALFEKQL